MYDTGLHFIRIRLIVAHHRNSPHHLALGLTAVADGLDAVQFRVILGVGFTAPTAGLREQSFFHTSRQFNTVGDETLTTRYWLILGRGCGRNENRKEEPDQEQGRREHVLGRGLHCGGELGDLEVKASCINTLRPSSRQDGLFPDDIFKSIFFNENVQILIKISLAFVHKAPINNTPALVQIMAWRRPGDKPLSEPMMVSLLTHMRQSVSMS